MTMAAGGGKCQWRNGNGNSGVKTYGLAMAAIYRNVAAHGRNVAAASNGVAINGVMM